MTEIFGGARIKFKDGDHWRVVNMDKDTAVLTNMDKDRLIEELRSISRLNSMITLGQVEICADQKRRALDESTMSATQREWYEKKSAFVRAVLRSCGEPLYSSTYTDIKGPARETFLACADDSGLSHKLAWKTWRVYRQSGYQKSSLADQRIYVGSKTQKYKVKNGRKPAIPQGKVLTEADIENIDEALEYLKRGYTELEAYESMLDSHYSVTKIELPKADGQKDNDLIPSMGKSIDLDEIERELLATKTVWVGLEERPSFYQFRYRRRKLHISDEIKKAVMGEAEFENNCRRLRDSPRRKLTKIGQLAEVDHCELDVYAVSELDPTKGIGKPVLHAMVDDATGMIQAFCVSLNNNSNDALTRLLINMCEDKVKWAAKYNIHLEGMDSLDTTLFPSFIPWKIRADRGSDFKGDKFLRFCDEQDIALDLVPGARGSYKAQIERLFRSFHDTIESSMSRKGLISPRYRDNSKREAMLTLDDITRVCIVFVIHYNQHIMPDRNKTVAQRMAPEFEPSPVGFFRYYLNRGDEVRTILKTKTNDLVYSLLDPITVTIHKDGLHYKGLVYDEPVDDLDLTLKIQRANGSEKMDVRRDPFDTSFLWYVSNGQYRIATLNPGRSIGFGSLSGITWAAFEEYKAIDKKKNAEDCIKKFERHHEAKADIDKVVQVATKPMLASDKNLKENRHIEKQIDNAKHGVVNSLAPKTMPIIESKIPVIETVEPALDDDYLKRILEDPDAALMEEYQKARK